MLLDSIIKETTDLSRVILPLEDWLDDTEVITEIISANVSLGTTGWGNTPFPPYAAPPPYDPTPLLFHSFTMEEDNRTLVVFVNYGTPGNVYTCTFVLAGTSARHFTFELGVQVSGVPPQQAFVPLPNVPPSTAWALPLAGGTMTGPLYLFEDPLYPTEAATKYYVDHVAGLAGGPFLSLSGGIMTGPLALAGPPAQPNDAATRAYVDNYFGPHPQFLPTAGGTMTGPLLLAADPTTPLEAAPKRYVDGSLQAYLALSGGTMTGMLTLAADPVTAMEAATQHYVQSYTQNYVTHNAVTATNVLGIAPGAAGVIIPMYWYPNNPYTDPVFLNVLALIRQYHQVPTLVIVNPGSPGGPGTAYDAVWGVAIARLKSAGAKVLGYVDTNYGDRPNAQVTADIDAWVTLYGAAPVDVWQDNTSAVEGIFFDRFAYNLTASDSSDNTARYQSYYAYVYSKGFAYVVGNAGGDEQPAWYALNPAAADVIVMWENTTFPTQSTLEGSSPNGHSYYTWRWNSVLVYAQASYNSANVALMSKYCKWLYVTDQSSANPWGAPSGYLSQLYQQLAGVSAPAGPTAVGGTSYIVAAGDISLIITPTAAFTLTLPAVASNTGRTLLVKSTAAFAVRSATANVVPLAGGAAGTAILAATVGKYAWLQSDGTNWQIMAAN